jgi:hypothetical protein
VAPTEKVAVWSAVTVALTGCEVMLGAVPLEFELEVVLAQPPTSNKNAATMSTTGTREQLIETSDKDARTGALRNRE